MAVRRRPLGAELNPRVEKALGVRESNPDVPAGEEDELPPLPEVVTPDTLCQWIARVAPGMDPKSNYRKQLVAAASRHEFRKKQRHKKPRSE